MPPSHLSQCGVLQVDFGVDLDSRVALVGPNGAGKSTLLKLMVGTLEPLDGMVKRHNHLKIGQYHQHLTELLDPELTPLEYMVGITTIATRVGQALCIVWPLAMMKGCSCLMSWLCLHFSCSVHVYNFHTHSVRD